MSRSRPPQLWRKRRNESDVRSVRRTRAICFGDKARQNFLDLVQQAPSFYPSSSLMALFRSSLARTSVRAPRYSPLFHVDIVVLVYVALCETDGPCLSRGITEEATVCQGDYTRPFLAPRNIKIPTYLRRAWRANRLRCTYFSHVCTVA